MLQNKLTSINVICMSVRNKNHSLRTFSVPESSTKSYHVVSLRREQV